MRRLLGSPDAESWRPVPVGNGRIRRIPAAYAGEQHPGERPLMLSQRVPHFGRRLARDGLGLGLEQEGGARLG